MYRLLRRGLGSTRKSPPLMGLRSSTASAGAPSRLIMKSRRNMSRVLSGGEFLRHTRGYEADWVCRSPQSPAQVSEVFCTAAFDVPISPLAVTWVADNVDTLPVVRSAAAWRSVSLPHGDADVRYRDFGRLGEGLKVGDVGALRTTGISAASTSNASCADAAPISTRCVSPLLRLTSRSASRGT